MKNLFKKPLKLILAGMFVVAMGFGMSTSLSISNDKTINLSTLVKSASARQEGSGTSNTGPGSRFDCTNWLGKKIGEGRTCESRNSHPCTDKNCD